MTPVSCIGRGDCYRACIASILNLPAAEVPDFSAADVAGGDAGWNEMFVVARDWLRGRGLGLFRTYCSAHWTNEKVLECFSRENRDVPIIFMGQSGKAGSRENHAVVALDGNVVHDPGGCGLAGPCLNGDFDPGWWYLDIVAFADFSTLQSTTLGRTE